MEPEGVVNSVVMGAETYFRAFALADNMARHDGDVEWIAPLAGETGPALVYRVRLSGNGEGELLRLLPRLRAGEIPATWVLTPYTMPSNLPQILLRHSFTELTGHGSHEYGMALALPQWSIPARNRERVEVKRVRTPADFSAWMQVVNTALHGWELLTLRHYAAWLAREELAFYLGCINGIPVATAAVFAEGETASLEFVSTAKAYRGRGAAYAVCCKALMDLQHVGVQLATLRCADDVEGLYQKLGFVRCYEQRLFRFEA